MKKKDLVRVNKPVETKYEIAAYIRKTSDQRGPVVFFENVKGFEMPVRKNFRRPEISTRKKPHKAEGLVAYEGKSW